MFRKKVVAPSPTNFMKSTQENFCFFEDIAKIRHYAIAIFPIIKTLVMDSLHDLLMRASFTWIKECLLNLFLSSSISIVVLYCSLMTLYLINLLKSVELLKNMD